MARTDDSDAYDAVETVSRDELEALQTERLRWSLAHAYNNVPFYRETFDKAEAVPAEVNNLTDLAKFPLLSKQDMRASYPFGRCNQAAFGMGGGIGARLARRLRFGAMAAGKS